MSLLSTTLKSAKAYLLTFSKLRRFFYCSILVLFCLVSFSTMGLSEQPILNYVNIGLYCLLGLLCLVYVFLYGKWNVGPFVILIVSFNVVTLLSYALNGFRSFVSSALTLGAMSLVFYEFLSQSKEAKEHSLYFVMLGTWLFIGYFVIYYWSDFIHPSVSFENRIGTLFGNQNDVARFLSFSLLINFYYAFFKKRYFCYIPIILSFYLIGLTGSISNLITSLFVCTLVIFFTSKKRGKIITVVSVLAILILGFLILQIPALAYFKNRIYGIIGSLTTVDTNTNDVSAAHRLKYALEAFYVFLESPIIGHGFNGFIQNSFGGFAHNNIAEVACDFGIIGLVIEETLILLPLRSVKKNHDVFSRFTLLICLYIFIFQFMLVSYYSKMEYLTLAFAFAHFQQTPNKQGLLVRVQDKIESSNGFKKFSNFGIKTIDFEKILPILFSALAAGFSVLTSFLIAKPLGSQLYGVIQYYLGLINTLTTIICFGINFVLIKSSQFASDKKQFFTKYMVLFDLISALSLIVFFVIAYFFLANVSYNVLLILLIGASAYFTAYGTMLGSYLLGTGKATLSVVLSSFLPKLLLFVASLTFLYVGGKDQFTSVYVWIYLVAYFLSEIPYSLTLYRKTKIKFDKKEILAVLTFFALSATQGLNSSLSKVIQGQYDAVQTAQGQSYTGILGLSLQIISLASLFSGAVTSLAQPIFAKFYGLHDEKSLLSTYRTVLRVNSYIAIPFCLALMVQAKSVLGLFGDSYSTNEGVVFFLLCGGSSLLSTICGPCGTLMTFSGHEKIQIVNGLVYIGVFVGLSLLLETSTIYGIPIAYAVSTVISETLKLIELWIFYKQIPIDWKTGLTLLIMAAVSCAFFFPLGFISDTIPWCVVNALFGVLIIIAFFAFSPFKNDKAFFGKKKSGEEMLNETK